MGRVADNVRNKTYVAMVEADAWPLNPLYRAAHEATNLLKRSAHSTAVRSCVIQRPTSALTTATKTVL